MEVLLSNPLQILMISSEVYPYAKSGGLADVLPKLAEALDSLGHRVKIVMPRYYGIRKYLLEKLPNPLGIPMGNREYWTGIHRTIIPGTRVEIYFIDHEQLYGRDGIYSEQGQQDFPDNAERFGVLSRGAFQLCKMLNWFPDIIQAHDWPAAPVLGYLRSIEALGQFRKTKGVFTIHNLGYQGIFPKESFDSLGLPVELRTSLGYDYYDSINFLQSALINAHGISTVSPGYAAEILKPELGFNMDRILRQKKKHFRGILNGMDYQIWNPETDQLIPFQYSKTALTGKSKNKAFLQQLGNLPLDPSVPIIGLVSRMVDQKGFHFLVEHNSRVLKAITSLPAQVVILGTGDKVIQQKLVEEAEINANLWVFIGYNEQTSHLIEAGSDFFLMPSLYEPCGLTQMYALSYGTIPIVSKTGGLKDTVVDIVKEPEIGTGYVIPSPLTGTTLLETLTSAVHTFYHEPQIIRSMQQRGMEQRFDWKLSAEEYVSFFESLISSRS
jgi:starch synthase